MNKVAILAFTLLAGCATVSPEAKIRTRLVEAGVKPRMAQCMAERLTDRLSLAQLRELNRMVGLVRKDAGAMTVNEIVDRLRATGDPRIVEVVTRAGVGCFIAG
ncbi:MAG: hypothetical protein EOP58_16115 [Sphingomonadales bacterium]|nr:MAG: hypothetical protein EOP58_16115 [Sphingomonadales bacterium]